MVLRQKGSKEVEKEECIAGTGIAHNVLGLI